MVITDACPTCGSKRYKKNGHTRHGKQNHQCKACERQFGATVDDHRISAAQRTMIERLLCQRICAAWDLPCRGRQSDVAVALYGGTLCRLS